jgi:hypothetical protein
MEIRSLSLPERLEHARTLLQASQQSLQLAWQAQHQDRWAEAAVQTLQAFKQALRAFLLFHDVSLPEEASLRDYWRSAVPLASSLELFANRTETVEALVAALADGRAPSVVEREAVRAAWYVARNTLYTLLGELPASLRPANSSSSAG